MYSEGVLFLLFDISETEHLHQILVTHCICIFWVCQLEVLPKQCSLYIRLREVMFRIWKWIQKYHPQRMSSKRKKIAEYIVDETLIKVGSELVWLWVAIESKNKQILALTTSRERNMFVTERFLSNIVRDYGKHPVSTDGGTWYPQACRFLKLNHHMHSSFEKSLIERTMQYIKDRTECFDDYFPCRTIKCKLKHVLNWMNLFVELS